MTRMFSRSPKNLIRPLVRELQPYAYGEQPKIRGLIKLNTNENPYPPSPQVLAAVRAAVDGRLRLYPNPTADRLREKLAKRHRCRPENLIVGNGSDELLALATRAFVEVRSAERGARNDFRKAWSNTSPPATRFIRCWRTFMARRKIAVPLKPGFQPAVARRIETRTRFGIFERR